MTDNNYKSLAETYPALLDAADWKQHVHPYTVQAVGMVDRRSNDIGAFLRIRLRDRICPASVVFDS